MTPDKNPGLVTPLRKCGRKCGVQQLMNSFDQLPRTLRDFFNNEVRVSWCMCTALQRYRDGGEAATLEHYRSLERSYR